MAWRKWQKSSGFLKGLPFLFCELRQKVGERRDASEPPNNEVMSNLLPHTESLPWVRYALVDHFKLLELETPEQEADRWYPGKRHLGLFQFLPSFGWKTRFHYTRFQIPPPESIMAKIKIDVLGTAWSLAIRHPALAFQIYHWLALWLSASHNMSQGPLSSPEIWNRNIIHLGFIMRRKWDSRYQVTGAQIGMWYLSGNSCLCVYRIWQAPLYMVGLSRWLSSKESTCQEGDVGSIPGSRSPLEKEMATHCSILAWEIPWTERSLVGCSPWGRKESGSTEQLNSGGLHMLITQGRSGVSFYRWSKWSSK